MPDRMQTRVLTASLQGHQPAKGTRWTTPSVTSHYESLTPRGRALSWCRVLGGLKGGRPIRHFKHTGVSGPRSTTGGNVRRLGAGKNWVKRWHCCTMTAIYPDGEDTNGIWGGVATSCHMPQGGKRWSWRHKP